MKWTWFPITEEEKQQFTGLCPQGEFRILPPTVDLSPIPSGLTQKCDSIFCAASGNAAGDTVYYMANLNRVDAKDNAIDQQPFGFVVNSESSFPSGCLVHHGNWTDRTTHPPMDFWDAISQSGVGVCYQTSQLPPVSSGRLEDIQIDSQTEAFSTLVQRLRVEAGNYNAKK